MFAANGGRRTRWSIQVCAAARVRVVYSNIEEKAGMAIYKSPSSRDATRTWRSDAGRRDSIKGRVEALASRG